MDGLTRSLELQKSIGAISGDLDVAKLIDDRFLPADAKTLK
jgi:NitT/TauT family transport system substrate-binding protein